MAAAEIKMTGSANMGVKYTEGATQETTLHHEIQLDISGSVATDNGLTFTAELDIESDRGGSCPSTSVSGTVAPVVVTKPTGNCFRSPDPKFTMSGAFGSLQIGETTDRASDSVGFGALEVGFDGIGLDDVVEQGYDAGTSDVRYTNSFGDISIAASMSSDEADDSVSVGFGYKGPVTIAVGFADDGSNEVTSISLKGSAAGFGYTLAATDNKALGNGYGVGVTYSLGNGMGIQAGYADHDDDADASYGLGMTYALGGGATLGGAVGSIDGTTKADLGVNFSF